VIEENWDEIDLTSIESLIEADASEGKTLEFKRELSPDDNGHKRKFLGEVTSLANDRRGDLVVGVVDQRGAATAIWPMTTSDPDQFKDRWVNITQNKTDPTLSSGLVDIKLVEVHEDESKLVDKNGNDSGWLLVARIQSSWRAPHREDYDSRFYGRSASGKMELDAGAIRQEMLQGQEIADRAQRFRTDRVGNIRVDEGALRLTEAPLLVLHTIPSDAFAPGGGIDPKDVNNDSDDRPRLLVSTDRRRVRATRYTADGYLKSTTWKDNGRVSAYTLPFRSGIIEAASDTVVAPESDRFEERDGFYVHSGSARSAFENYLPQTIEFQKDQNASFPIYVYASAVNVEGCRVGTHDQFHHDGALREIDRDIAHLPEVVVETPQHDIENSIDVLMDSLFHASGYSGEPS